MACSVGEDGIPDAGLAAADFGVKFGEGISIVSLEFIAFFFKYSESFSFILLSADQHQLGALGREAKLIDPLPVGWLSHFFFG